MNRKIKTYSLSSELSLDTKQLLQKAKLYINKQRHKLLTRKMPKTYKVPMYNKTQNHKYKKIHPQIHPQIHPPHPNKIKQNYIKKLINKYYDNDKVVNDYLDTAHKKIHIFPKQQRVIVFGDIHGDLEAAIECFIIAGCIDKIKLPNDKSVNNMNMFFKNIKWIGKDTYVVQLGDQIDRVRPQKWDHNDITRDNAYKDEGSTLEILYLFYYLNELAKEHEGYVFSIIGNHEIMNIEADFRYVSLKEFKCFKQHLTNTYTRNSKYPYNSRTLKKNRYKLKQIQTDFTDQNEHNTDSNNRHTTSSNTFTNVPEGFRERLYAFSPTGLCSNIIGTNNYVLLQIGHWLFCHGSPVLNTVKTYNTDLINSIVSMYLLGIDTDDKEISKHYNKITNSHHSESILWNRDFGELDITPTKEKDLTKQLDTILNEYNKKNRPMNGSSSSNSSSNRNQATHIAIGHTVQYTSNKGINSICDGRVWRCDVGMSRAFGQRKDEPHRKPQVLEILNSDGNEKINVLV